jgi:hypothetical protein
MRPEGLESLEAFLAELLAIAAAGGHAGPDLLAPP